MLQRLNERINPAGTKEIVVRRYGDWQVEIIIPDVDTNEVERIKKLISTAGLLEFRIVANSVQHGDIDPGRDHSRPKTRPNADPSTVMQGTREVGYWARVGREAKEVKGGFRPLKVSVASSHDSQLRPPARSSSCHPRCRWTRNTPWSGG